MSVPLTGSLSLNGVYSELFQSSASKPPFNNRSLNSRNLREFVDKKEPQPIAITDLRGQCCALRPDLISKSPTSTPGINSVYQVQGTNQWGDSIVSDYYVPASSAKPDGDGNPVPTSYGDYYYLETRGSSRHTPARRTANNISCWFYAPRSAYFDVKLTGEYYCDMGDDGGSGLWIVGRSWDAGYGVGNMYTWSRRKVDVQEYLPRWKTYSVTVGPTSDLYPFSIVNIEMQNVESAANGTIQWFKACHLEVKDTGNFNLMRRVRDER